MVYLSSEARYSFASVAALTALVLTNLPPAFKDMSVQVTSMPHTKA